MKLAAVTCAWMRSRRLPGKCLLPLDGKPLLQHTIDFAEALDLELYVFTPDVEVMRYVSDKCPIIFEPEEFCDHDRNLTYEEMQYCQQVLGANHIVLLQPTQPVRNTFFLRTCLNFVENEGLDYTRVLIKNDGSWRDSGLMYTFSHRHLVHKQQASDFYYGGPWFDIDTEEDLRRCEQWLRR